MAIWTSLTSPRINFNGWLINDSDCVLLKVSPLAPLTVACDQCGGPAEYKMSVVTGDFFSPVCQGCLQDGFENPRSPDTYFAPVSASDVVSYSDGGAQLVVKL